MPSRKGKSSLALEIKEISETGSFDGQLAVYNNVDLGGDKILPGAFKKTIQEHGSTVPLLWQHDPHEPIGTLTLMDGPDALNVKGQLLMDLDRAKQAYLLLKAGVIKGLSIGFESVKDSVDNGVRILKEVKLWEGSVVTFPMNPSAMVTSLKAMSAGQSVDDFNSSLSEQQLQDAGYQMRSSLFVALGSVIWAGGLSKQDKIDATGTIIEQFSDAYLAYLPQYLDWLSAEYGDMEMMGRLQMEEKSFAQMLARANKTAPVMALETKEGRRLSAATVTTLKQAQEHVKSLGDIFDALFDGAADDDPDDDSDDDDDDSDDDGDDDTTKSKAAKESKTEPAKNHSAAEAQILEIRSLIPKA